MEFWQSQTLQVVGKSLTTYPVLLEVSVIVTRLEEVPEDWRKDHVTAIFRKGKKEDPGN